MSAGGGPGRGGGEGYRRLAPGRHGLAPDTVAEDQRWRLLSAAAELFGERGYAALTSRRIAARAGVSAATFYANFGDLDECLAAAGDVAAETLAELCEECGGREGEPLAAPLGFLAARPGVAALLGSEGATIPALRGTRIGLRERLADRLAGLRGTGPPGAAERILVGAALILPVPPGRGTESARELRRLLLGGAG